MKKRETRTYQQRESRVMAGGEELRTGASGVPLALAADLHRMVIVNRQPPRRTASELGLSVDVSARMLALLKRHGVPSRDRMILLSVGYPERTYAEIAAAFHTTVDHVNAVVLRASSIRRAEPLSTELWEDITEKTMTQDEIAIRAAEVRRLNELDKREVPERPVGRAPGREGLGGLSPRQRCRRGPRQEDCAARA